MRKVKWGVLGVAKIATEKVIPAMQTTDTCAIVAIASRDPANRRSQATTLARRRAPATFRFQRGRPVTQNWDTDIFRNDWAHIAGGPAEAL